MKVNIDYDGEEDILYFYPNEKHVDFSVDYDDIILDVSGNKVVGVEIMDASEKFSSDEEDTERLKKAISSINKAHMNVKCGLNSISVKIGFESSVPQKTREGMIIQVPIKKEMMVQI